MKTSLVTTKNTMCTWEYGWNLLVAMIIFANLLINTAIYDVGKQYRHDLSASILSSLIKYTEGQNEMYYLRKSRNQVQH